MTRPIAVLALLSALSAPLAAEPREYAEFGFRIELPAGWSERRGPSTAQAPLQVVLQPPGAPEDVQLTLWAQDQPSAEDADAYRAQLLRWLKQQPDYSEVTAAEGRLGNAAAPGIDFVARSGGRTYRVRQLVRAGTGFRWIAQLLAPAESYDRWHPVLQQALDGFAVLEPSAEARAAATVRAAAARCGSEMGWVADWESAAARARSEGRRILVYVHAQAGFQVSDAAMTGPFMDPDVLDAVRARYVALHWSSGLPIPLRDPAVYGLGPNTFGQALLVVEPSGRVVRECASLDPWTVHDVLAPWLAEPPVDETAAGRLARATWLRRKRRGEEALAELDAARRAGAPESAVLAEEALVRLRLARYTEAAQDFARLVERHPGSARATEAAYWLGAILLAAGRKADAGNTWRGLIAARPDDRWAWKAAGVLSGTGFALGVGERLDWPAEEVLSAARGQAPAPLSLPQDASDADRDGLAARAREEARAWLLRHQRRDGSWTSPTEALHPGGVPSDFTEAITALAARALLADEPDEPALLAIRRGRDWLLARHEARRRAPAAPAFFMDYSVWRDSCTLRLFADLCLADPAAGESLRATMTEIVDHLAALQRPGGGWSYLVQMDLSAAGARIEQSISFVTATVVLALLRAREAGVTVPDALLAGGLDALERMRTEEGTFEYMVDPAGKRLGTPGGVPGAAGRGPLCALALWKGGRADAAAVRRTLDLFLAHRTALFRERGKALMHTGEDGQGSHYLLYDLSCAAAAVAELPAGQRAPYRTAVREEILRLRTEGGGFRDTPLLGEDCGAALALHALRLLEMP